MIRPQTEFQKIFIEGFGSFSRPTVFNLAQGGVNMVYGTNGEGKTTFFSALAWCLYKVNLKDVSNENVATWEIYREESFRGTRVVVEFIIGESTYLVARHLHFKGTTQKLKADSKLMIFKDAVLVGEAQHKGDMQTYINGILGMDSKAFLNSVLFGQRMKRLVEADNTEKRALFENLFALGFVEIAKEKAKITLNGLEKEVLSISHQIDALEQKRTNLTEQLEQGEGILAVFNDNIKKREFDLVNKSFEIEKNIQANAKEIKKLEKKLASFKQYQEQLIKFESDLSEAKKVWESNKTLLIEAQRTNTAAGNEYKKSEQNISRLQSELEAISTVCPTCTQNLPVEKVNTAKNNLRDQIEKEKDVKIAMMDRWNLEAKKVKETTDLVAENLASVKKLEEILKTTEKDKEEINTINQTIAVLKSKQEGNAERVDEITREIEKIKTEKKPKIDIEGLRLQLKDAEDEVSNLNLGIEVKKAEVTRTQWWINKGFSAAGLKAFVFNAMLSQLNIYVEKYAARLGIIIRFSIDLSLASKPFVTSCFKDGNDINYKELSGGEKQRVDVCLAFAMQDLITHASDVNILIMDEIFEGLDAEGREVVFDLIRTKAGQGKTVYVISHSDTIDSLNSKSITIKKDPELKFSYIE